ncbi:LysR substrate-binding domain-containing protein [Leucobacter salsicius]|uniref:LysR substrate-binding domain-containing protein n=1 Tax=Leucobacter salsicius TaxID=664638 RepID=UPI00034AB838|nr:LysR substrate-binding domain-containing protein [Leucobacter salsicius]
MSEHVIPFTYAADEASGEAAAAADTAAPDPTSGAPGMRLGFVRGIAPTKWAKRYLVATHTPLELVPVAATFAPSKADSPDYDMLLERTAPSGTPAGAEEGGPRRALRLYGETIALVVPVDHELAEETEISTADLALIPLIDHPDHAPEWPAPEPWADPAWKPRNARAALQLVATGVGAMLLPLPLARHISNKKDHVLIAVVGDLAPTMVWATWQASRDDSDMQQLAGILRGRTARSSRVGSPAAGSPTEAPKKQAAPAPQKKKPKLKPNSRGAQLAAVREKAERAKAEKRAAARKTKKGGGKRH